MALFFLWFCYDFYQQMKRDERRDRAKKNREKREEFSDYFKKKMSDPEEMEKMLLKAAEELKLPKEEVERIKQDLSRLSPEEKLDYVKKQLADDKMLQKFAQVVNKDVDEMKKLKGILEPDKQEIDESYLMDERRSQEREMRSEFEDPMAQIAAGQRDVYGNFNF